MELGFEAYRTKTPQYELTFEELLPGFTLTERLILADVVLSYEVFRTNYCLRRFNFSDCAREVVDVSHNTYLLVERYGAFFEEMEDDIKSLISDKKKYKTDFSLGFGPLDELIYLSALIRSIHFVDDIKDEVSVDEGSNMLHRNTVMSNLSCYTQVFGLIGRGARVKANCIKLMMLLDRQVLKKKVKFTAKKPKGKIEFKTEVYIRFNIAEPFSYKDKVNITFGRRPFMYLREYLICASHLTLCPAIKKCNYQWIKNEIHEEALKVLSAKAIEISKAH